VTGVLTCALPIVRDGAAVGAGAPCVAVRRARRIAGGVGVRSASGSGPVLVVGIGSRAARSLTVRVVVAIRILFALGDDGLPVGGEGPLGTGAALREVLELHRFVSA